MKRIKLTPARVRALTWLDGRSPTRVSELLRALNIPACAATNTLEALVSRGLARWTKYTSSPFSHSHIVITAAGHRWLDG